jgi:hypothetical protein
MSYLYQSRQLHPRYCGLGLGTIARGMGFVGPDQPWTVENAKKVIVQPTEKCPYGNEKQRLSEFSHPKTMVGGESVDNTACFKTGKIWEAERAGNPRRVEWCCPPQKYLPKRDLTQPEYETHKDRCVPYRHPYSGKIRETYPKWHDVNMYLGSSCSRTGVLDNGYELVCCPEVDRAAMTKLLDNNIVMATATPAQEAEWEAQRQELLLEQEQAAAAAAPPPPTFIGRYGFVILMVGGAVGLGVTAALFRRFSVATKKAEESKAAVAALQARQGEA